MYKSISYLEQVLENTKSIISEVVIDDFSEEYEGVTLNINGIKYRSRLAKKTPKKKGYFVAFWEKNKLGVNQAYSFDTYPDKLVINIIDGELSGQFIFPKSVLLKNKILRDGLSKGKMAMRVYPSWETSLNKTASATQKWQCLYFINTSKSFEQEKINQLYLK